MPDSGGGGGGDTSHTQCYKTKVRQSVGLGIFINKACYVGIYKIAGARMACPFESIFG